MRPLTLGDSGNDVKKLQTAIRRTIKAYDYPVLLPIVDGDYGRVTQRAAYSIGYWLGISDSKLFGAILSEGCQRIIYNPKGRGTYTKLQGKRRQRAIQKRYPPGTGSAGESGTEAAGCYPVNGYPVPFWIVRHLNFAILSAGWEPLTLTSAYRSDTYQNHICNSPPYPRPCAPAGSSNHRERDSKNHKGAIDTTQSRVFRQAMSASPKPGYLEWYGAGDPVHFSHNGR